MQEDDLIYKLEEKSGLLAPIAVGLAEDNTLDGLAEKVKEWGREKRIADPYRQFAKLSEELGELAHELTRGHTNSKQTEDALGDSLVCLIILADILGYDLRDCLELAYDEIKGRTGKLVDGVFVKSVDLPEQQ